MSLTQQVLREREAAKRRPRQRRLPELGSVEPLADSFIGLAPPPVKQASLDFARARNDLSEARARVDAAKAAIPDARWQDEQAARQAAAKNRKPPKPTAPEAQEAVATAERLVPGYEYEARAKMVAYVKAVRAHQDEIREVAESRRRTTVGEVRSLVDQLDTALASLRGLDTLLAELDGPVGYGRHPVFKPRAMNPDREATAALAAIRASMNGTGR